MTARPPIVIDPESELAELREYLGDSYDNGLLHDHVRELERELREAGNEAQLYRSSEMYLYDLTVFAMSETKLPYLRDLCDLVEPGARVLDYGCGIGSDGLLLLERGYDVSFADFDNPSVRYLRWRLEHRGLEAPIHDLDAGDPPGGFDAAYAFDVIEHVEEPLQLLARMESLADLVVVNFLEPQQGETSLHHPLPVRDLLRHATERRLRRYRRYHGRSHLVLYQPADAGPANAIASRLARLRGRLASAR